MGAKCKRKLGGALSPARHTCDCKGYEPRLLSTVCRNCSHPRADPR